MESLLSKFISAKTLLLEIVGAIILLFVAFITGEVKGNKRGAAKVEAKNAGEVAAAVSEGNDVVVEVRQIPEGGAREKLKESWLRK